MRTSWFVSTIIAVLYLLTPTFGTWAYLGTETYVSRPGRSSSPDGTWSAAWDGYGTVWFSPYYLEASGWTEGDATATLTPWFSGSSRYALAWSKVWGRSGYRNVPNRPGESDAIEGTICTTIDDLRLEYYGDALGSSNYYYPGGAYCEAECQARGFGGAHYSQLSAEGTGEGQSASGGYHDARTEYPEDPGISCSSWVQISGWEPPIPGVSGPMGWYWGYLVMYGEIEEEFSYTDEEMQCVGYFSLVSEVGGECQVYGSLWYSDPQAWPSFYTTGWYHVSGTTEVTLVGDITYR